MFKRVGRSLYFNNILLEKDENEEEKEIIKLKHLLPSTKKLYMIDYSNNIITFVDNKGEVIELPFEKMFIEITQDKDKANILKFHIRLRSQPTASTEPGIIKSHRKG